MISHRNWIFKLLFSVVESKLKHHMVKKIKFKKLVVRKMCQNMKKIIKLRVQKAPQAPSDLDHRIRLEMLCSLKKNNTSIGPPTSKLSHFKDFDPFQAVPQAPMALKRTVSFSLV